MDKDILLIDLGKAIDQLLPALPVRTLRNKDAYAVLACILSWNPLLVMKLTLRRLTLRLKGEHLSGSCQPVTD